MSSSFCRSYLKSGSAFTTGSSFRTLFWSPALKTGTGESWQRVAKAWSAGRPSLRHRDRTLPLLPRAGGGRPPPRSRGRHGRRNPPPTPPTRPTFPFLPLSLLPPSFPSSFCSPASFPLSPPVARARARAPAAHHTHSRAQRRGGAAVVWSSSSSPSASSPFQASLLHHPPPRPLSHPARFPSCPPKQSPRCW